MDQILAYTIQLGRNMWWDKTGKAPIPQNYLQVIFPKYETFHKDKTCFRLLVDHAAKEGMNTIVVNIGEGLTYDSHPELNLDGSWTKEELKEELNHIRSLNMIAVPMLNFSAAHDVWLGKYERMVGTKAYYQVCADLIDEVCELFDNPPYFHLGMDEETADAQQLYNHTTVRHEVVFFRDLKFYFDCVRKHGCTPWIFSDSYNRFPKAFLEQVEKDVLLSNENISFSGKTEELHSYTCYPQELPELAKHGYSILPMSCCYRYANMPEQTANYIKTNGMEQQVRGVLCYPYLFCESEHRFKLMFEATRAAKVFTERNKS